MPEAPITVLVVDDELHARDRLRVLLSGDPDIQILGECETGLEAIAAATRLHPDLLFLDVQMPDLDGLGVIRALPTEETPEIVFVTAHSRYMERAFEIHAVDYLRKPYTDARFASALEYAKQRIRAAHPALSGRGDCVAEAASRYSPMLANLQAMRFDPRMAVQDGETGIWHIVNQEEVDWISAEASGRVRVHVGSSSYVWRKTLTELERTLDTNIFLRIHRSCIVNVSRIRHVKPLQKGEFAIVLEGDKMLDSGRTYRDAIERFLMTRA